MRRWERGQRVTCHCGGELRAGGVVSARRRGRDPIVELADGGERHECPTAILVDRRGDRAESPRRLTHWVPRVALDEVTGPWLRSIPAYRRAAAVTAALRSAAISHGYAPCENNDD